MKENRRKWAAVFATAALVTVFALTACQPAIGSGPYMVNFSSNGGTGTMAPVTTTDGRYVLPANGFTAPADQEFKGWSLLPSSAILQPGNTIYIDGPANSSVTVSAIWEAKPNYTVTFDANGGSGEMKSVTTTNSRYELPQNSFTPPDGQEFKGWSVRPMNTETGSRIFYNPGDSINIEPANSSVKVYALWKAKS